MATTLSTVLNEHLRDRCIQRLGLAGAAQASLEQLNGDSGVRMASGVPRESGTVSATPNDTYYDYIDTWFLIDHDAQWHLNCGGCGIRHDRPPAQCGPEIAGRVIRAEDAWARVGFRDESTVVGIVDLGILGGGPQAASTHEDPAVIPIDNDTLRASIQIHPFDNWCGDHGTRMAGLAVAKTGNEHGVAGVYSNCSILDVEVASQPCVCSVSPCAAPSTVIRSNIILTSIANRRGHRAEVGGLQWSSYMQTPIPDARSVRPSGAASLGSS